MTVDIRRKTGKRYLWMLGMAGAALLWVLAGRGSTDDSSEKGTVLGNALKMSLAEGFETFMYEQFLPMLSFSAQDTTTPYLAQKQVTDIMPFYGYATEEMAMARIDAGGADDKSEKVTQGDEGQGEMVEQRIAGGESPSVTGNLSVTENQAATETQDVEVQGAETPPNAETAQGTEAPPGMEKQELEATVIVENQDFVPHVLQNPIDLSMLSDYETLVQNFYTIDAGTMAGSDQLNAEVLSGHDLTIEKKAEGPQILIYHTHSQETFADSVPGDTSTSIVGVGEHLASILREEYGYQVLHHTGEYDVESRNDAYSVSLPAIEQVLAENPTIEVVIDLHRDQMAEETRLVMDVDGRPTARFMFFNGLSRTKTTGNIGYLYNEYQEENLAFSFQMQLATEQYYPGLARKIYLKGYRYNMHLKPRTLLIELGAQNNTVEEVMNACDPIAHVLDMVLTGEGE